jgi:hypothetical protein
VDAVTFLAIIKDSVSAIKIDGGGNGGEVVLSIPETNLGGFIQVAALRNQVLKVTIEPTGDTD